MTKTIKAVNDTYAAERREEYALMFENVARQIRERGELPEGAFIAISWMDGDIGKLYECEPGFSAFKLAGIFEFLKLQILDDIAGF